MELRLVFALASEYLFSSSRPRKFSNPGGISQRVSKEWEAGLMAFHPFPTLSFRWPAFEARIKIRRFRSHRLPSAQQVLLLVGNLPTGTEGSLRSRSCLLRRN